MNNTFKLSNNIFNYDLSATEITVLAALYSVYTHSHTAVAVKIKQSTLAKKCGFKKSDTVSNAIGKLLRKGLILGAQRQLTQKGYPSTYIYILPRIDKNTGYFYISRKVFERRLTPVQMRMYLFIAKCIQAKTKTCWQSYNDISVKLGISRSSVIKTIKELVQFHLIAKIKIKKQDNSYSDNHYVLLDLHLPVKFTKRKRLKLSPTVFSLANKQHCSNHHNHYIYYTISKKGACQVFLQKRKNCFSFSSRGSPKKRKSYIEPTISTRRKNKRIKIIHRVDSLVL
ncbi:MAG: helix-turn-helix domain-containing protein [Acutalibacteraceae bacterium]